MARVPVRRAGHQAVGVQFDRVAAVCAALAVVGLAAFLLVRNEAIASPQLFFALRVVISFATAVLGATIPGFLEVGWKGSGLAVRAGGALALFVLTYLYTPDLVPTEQPPVERGGRTTVIQDRPTVTGAPGGVTAGTITGGTFNILGLSEEDRAAAERRHDELLRGQEDLLRANQQLLAAVARERGVPPAALQVLLARMGEAGVPEGQVEARLRAVADEYVALQAELPQRPAGDRLDAAKVRAQAQALLELGDLDGARAVLAGAAAAGQAVRDRIAREQAELESCSATFNKMWERTEACTPRSDPACRERAMQAAEKLLGSCSGCQRKAEMERRIAEDRLQHKKTKQVVHMHFEKPCNTVRVFLRSYVASWQSA